MERFELAMTDKSNTTSRIHPQAFSFSAKEFSVKGEPPKALAYLTCSRKGHLTLVTAHIRLTLPAQTEYSSRG
jgi:hypothetical protein